MVILVGKTRLHCGTESLALVMTVGSSSWSERPGSIAASATFVEDVEGYWAVILVGKTRLHCGA